MSRKPRRKIKDTIRDIITNDTIYFEIENPECFKSHSDIYESWLHGESIWKICSRFNIRVPEAEEMIRHGALINIRELKKRSAKTGSKSSKKKQPST